MHAHDIHVHVLNFTSMHTQHPIHARANQHECERNIRCHCTPASVSLLHHTCAHFCVKIRGRVGVRGRTREYLFKSSWCVWVGCGCARAGASISGSDDEDSDAADDEDEFREVIEAQATLGEI